jgi:hypothetical protein
VIAITVEPLISSSTPSCRLTPHHQPPLAPTTVPCYRLVFAVAAATAGKPGESASLDIAAPCMETSPASCCSDLSGRACSREYHKGPTFLRIVVRLAAGTVATHHCPLGCVSLMRHRHACFVLRAFSTQWCHIVCVCVTGIGLCTTSLQPPTSHQSACEPLYIEFVPCR